MSTHEVDMSSYNLYHSTKIAVFTATSLISSMKKSRLMFQPILVGLLRKVIFKAYPKSIKLLRVAGKSMRVIQGHPGRTSSGEEIKMSA